MLMFNICVTFLGDFAHDEEYFHIALPLFVIYTIFSIFGVIFAIICLIFNMWFRNQKYEAYSTM